MFMKIIAGVLVVATIVGVFVFVQQSRDDQEQTSTEPTAMNEPDTRATFDKSQYSLSEPDSLWVIANKQNAIPTSFVPDLVVPDVRLRLAASEQQMQVSQLALKDLRSMFEAASNRGVNLVFGSGYRSADLQAQFYNSYVAQDGQAAADAYSARPGHSEHQTGLAVDITSPGGVCHLEICWEDTPEGKWVAENAHKFGFIIRYLEGKENITGYQYEPWHLRYVGKDLATEIPRNQTLEEFFGLPHAPDYQ